MGMEWKPLVCIIAGIIVIVLQGIRIFDWLSIEMKDDLGSKYMAQHHSWVDLVMPVLFLIAACLLIYGVMKGKQMLMIPFIVIGIIYSILDIYYLIDYHTGKLIFEAIIDIFVTVVAIIVFLDMGGVES